MLGAFAERYHAGLTHRLGIVEDVFEAQRIGGKRVFIVVGGVDECDVLGGGIVHQTDIALPGHATIRAVVATARCDAKCVSAMGLLLTVVGASQVEQFALAAVVASHKQRTADGVGANLVPQSLDAVVRGLCVVEVGVGEVEADIHDAHHHVLARIGLRQTRSCIDGQRIQVDGHRVHQRVCAAPSLDATHVAFLRKST